MNSRYGNGLSLALFFFVATLSAANHPADHTAPAEVKARALANYGKLPLSFEENRGQADSHVRFMSRGSGYEIGLAPAEVFLKVQAPGKPGQPSKQSAIRMSFAGAQSSAAITGGERQSGVSSYFVGNDRSKWLSGIPNYSRVHYDGIYPGVDLVLYGNRGRLEYDFEVAPGADPRAIRLAFDGIDSMHIDGAGDLVVRTAAGEMRQHKPIVYQESGGLRHTIEGRYVLQSRNRVAFEVGGYDARKPLVIDPVLSFATYLGSRGDDVFGVSATANTTTYPAVAADSEGNVYVTGYMGGNVSSFPGPPTILTAGGEGGGTDVFVVKMNPTGTALLYSVVFGTGFSEDVPGGIAVDTVGNAYVTGHTNSPDFPIMPKPGAAQTNFYGGINAFVTKVNTTGTALVYSTYLGGSGSFAGGAIAVDHSGNAYVTGTAAASGSTPFCTVCSISSTPSAGFLTEVNAGGTGFTYSTYLPAGIGYGIAVDSNGDAYVTGSTGSAATPSPAQGYVLKVNNTGGTGGGYGPVLLGTAGLQTIGFGIALDAQNDAYVAGMTNDPSFPQITGAAAQRTYGGGLTDAFAVKLNANGDLPPVYGTYIGGLGTNLLPERASGIGVDGNGYAYVAGTTQCIGFPTPNSVANARNGGPAVLMKGSLSGSSSSWSPTSLAGGFDQATAIAFDSAGNIYAGTTAINATGGGIYKSTDGGNTWSPVGLALTSIDAIAIDPNSPTTFYAIGGGKIYRSTDSGVTWPIVGPAIGTSGSLAIAPTSPSTVYAGSSTGLLYSTNGTTWNTTTVPAPVAGGVVVAVDPTNAHTAYAGTGYNGTTSFGVYKTINQGAAWSPVNNLNFPPVPVTSLAFNSTGTLYAATSNGLFYTSNGGTNWTLATLGLEVVSTPFLVAVDAQDNVYVAFAGSGVSVGTNGGTVQSDWSALTYSGLTQNQITALAVDPATGIPYAGIISATDAFLTQISPDGSTFSSSTCIGGADNDLGQSVAVLPNGGVYLSGLTISTDFPATPGALQGSSAGLFDAFVAGIDIPPDQITSPVPEITLSGSLATFSWNMVSGATQYQLTVGTTPGGTNLFNGTTTGTSQTVTFIPCTGGTVYVQLLAEVSGSFQPAGDTSYPCKSAIGDFNQDGYQDLVWQNSSTREVTVNYFGGASPVFQDGWSWLDSTGEPGWRIVAVADMNGDGVPDLIWQNTSTTQVVVHYYGGAGGAVYQGWAYLDAVGAPGWTVVGAADFDKNGTPDLIWQNTASTQVVVHYYGYSGGAPVYQGWAYLDAVGAPGWTVVGAADFDGNGTPDLVWQNTASTQVVVHYYGGTGGAVYQGWAYLDGAGAPGWTVKCAADLNADGVPDLIWQNNTTGQVVVHFYGGAGGAVYEGWNWLNAATTVGWHVAGAADFDGNGEPDLVWENNTSSQVTVNYYFLGGAVYQSMNTLDPGVPGWTVVGTGDFDGNGVPDLVWQNDSTHQVVVHYYGGAGGAVYQGWAYLDGAGVPGWTVVGVADVNGDGVPDLIWQNTTTTQVVVHYYGGAGGAVYQGWAYLDGVGAPGWTVVGAADFDGNGTPDLVWQNTASTQVVVHYYGGAGGTVYQGWAYLDQAGAPGWTVVGASDFDGNGVPDLVWQNNSTAQVVVHYYGGHGGTVYKGWNWLSSAGSPGWRAIVPRSR